MANRKSMSNSSMYAVLGMLALGPRTGYDIKKMMERSTRYFWNENFGQIYPHLNRLLSSGNVTLHVEKQEGKPDRKVYAITEKGRKTLADWLGTPFDISLLERKNELLLRLFFGPHVPPATHVAHLETFANKLSEHLHELETMERELRACYADDDENLPYWLMTIRYGKLQTEALLQWCGESLRELKKLDGRQHGVGDIRSSKQSPDPAKQADHRHDDY